MNHADRAALMTGHATIALVLASGEWAGPVGWVSATVFALVVIVYSGVLFGGRVAKQLDMSGDADEVEA